MLKAGDQTCNYTMDQRTIAWRDGRMLDHSKCNHLPEVTSARYIGDSTDRKYTVNTDECVRLCEAIAEFWGNDVCDAPIWPGAYLTEQDVPIRDLIRAAVGWRKP